VILTCQPFILIHSYVSPTRKTNYHYLRRILLLRSFWGSRKTRCYHTANKNLYWASPVLLECEMRPVARQCGEKWTLNRLPKSSYLHIFLGWGNRLWYLLDVFDGISNRVQNLYNGDWNQTWLYWLMYIFWCFHNLRLWAEGWLSVCVCMCVVDVFVGVDQGLWYCWCYLSERQNSPWVRNDCGNAPKMTRGIRWTV